MIFFSACSGHKKLSPEMRFVRDNVEFASLQTDNMVRELGEPVSYTHLTLPTIA